MREKTKLPKYGHINRRISPRTGAPTYQGQFAPPGFPSQSETCPTLEGAEAFVIRIAAKYKKDQQEIAKSQSGEEVDLFSERLRESCALFLESKECSDRHESHMPGLLKMIGNPTIGQLKKSWIKDFIFRCRKPDAAPGEKPYAFSTIAGFLSQIHVVVEFRADELDQVSPSFIVESKYFETAARAEGLPWKDGAYFVKRTRRIESEFDEEERLMAKVVDPDELVQKQLRLLVRFALETCARQKEMVLATWDEISPARKSWNIPRHKTKPRQMTLFSGARAILDELSQMRKPGEARLFYALESPGWVCRKFKGFIKEAGLSDFRFHDLRHEAITRLVATQRLEMALLMPMVGHSSPKMTALYTHLREMELERMTIEAPTAAWWRAKNPASQPIGETEILDDALLPG